MAEEEEIKETVRGRGHFFLLALPGGLLTFSTLVTRAVLVDLILYRTCLVSMNMNETDCLLLRFNATSPEAIELEAKVQQHGSIIVMAKDLIRNILPTLASLILVPWTDRGGRRPILLAAFGGNALAYVALALMCQWNISPWYLMIALIPSRIFGGMGIVRIVSVCYISDVTTEENRTMQLTLLEATFSAARVISTLTAPLIYENYGYTHIFATAATCCTSAVIYTYFWLPESVKDPSKKMIHGLGMIPFVKGIVTMSSLERDHFRRPFVWLAIFIIGLNKVIDKGHKGISFLFTRTRLAWGVRQYSHFNTSNSVLHIASLYIVSIRGHFSGVPDTLLIFVGLLSTWGCALTKSLAWQSWHMYLAMCIDILGRLSGPVTKSVLSKFVPPQDIGKMFSLVGLVQILASLCGTPLYISVYFNYMPPIYPSPVYLLSVGFYTLSILCTGCMQLMIKKSRTTSNYTAAAQEDL